MGTALCIRQCLVSATLNQAESATVGSKNIDDVHVAWRRERSARCVPFRVRGRYPLGYQMLDTSADLLSETRCFQHPPIQSMMNGVLLWTAYNVTM